MDIGMRQHSGRQREDSATQTRRRNASPAVLQIPRRISAAAKAASKKHKKPSVASPQKAILQTKHLKKKPRRKKQRTESVIKAKAKPLTTSPPKAGPDESPQPKVDAPPTIPDDNEERKSADAESEHQRTNETNHSPPKPQASVPEAREPDPTSQLKIEEELHAFEEDNEERRRQAMEASRKRREAIRAKYKQHAKASGGPQQPPLRASDQRSLKPRQKEKLLPTEPANSNNVSSPEKSKKRTDPNSSSSSQAGETVATEAQKCKAKSINREAQLREILLRKFMIKRMAEIEQQTAEGGEFSEEEEQSDSEDDRRPDDKSSAAESSAAESSAAAQESEASAAKASMAFDMFSDEVPAQPAAPSSAVDAVAESDVMEEYAVPVDNDDDEDG